MNWGTERSRAVAHSQRFPIDLVIVGVVLMGTFATLSFDAGAFLRVLTGAVTLLFLPGYVTTAALFPRHDRTATDAGWALSGRFTLRERAVVSFGLSIALLPMLGLVAGRLTSGFTPRVVYVMIGVYVGVVGLVAAFHRYRLPEDERLYIPFGAWMAEAEGVVSGTGRTNRVLALALICSVVLAGGVFAYALATPVGGETYTDFHLVTEDEDGEYVSAGYPEQLNRGQPTELTWGIKSYETAETEYTVVVTLERVVERDGELQRLEVSELDRRSVTVAPGEHELQDHEIVPTLVGDDLRVGYYLYRGDAPETASADDAYRHLHIWVDVESGG